MVIQTKGLTKRYGRGALAVDDLNLEVQRGEVYGFLGPNGAGKTTTLRMLVGLIRPTKGEARVLGLRPGTPKELSSLGALIEAPAFYPYLSGRNNLKVIARYCGVALEECDAALQQVDLVGAAKAKYKTYSTGMKQRLGLAAALLKKPEVLILDEPSSGLDPQGIVEMRDLIRELASGERTILLSSHQLSEVEQVCDRIGVINKGRLVAEGKLEELRGPAGVVVSARPLDRAVEVAKVIAGNDRVQIIGGRIHLRIAPDRTSEVVRRMVEAGIEVDETRRDERSLEEIFLTLTADQDGSNPAS